MRLCKLEEELKIKIIKDNTQKLHWLPKMIKGNKMQKSPSTDGWELCASDP